jgi:arylsulfatase A-like enzyme
VFFHDVRPLIADATRPSPYPSIYGGYLDSQRAITHEGWKLIVYPAGPVELLFHVAEDPLEEHDLARDPAQADRIADLRTRLAALGASLNDPLPGAGTRR